MCDNRKILFFFFKPKNLINTAVLMGIMTNDYSFKTIRLHHEVHFFLNAIMTLIIDFLLGYK